MLRLLRAILAIVLAVAVQYVDGNKRNGYISELVNDDDVFFSRGEGNNSVLSCVYENCFYNSFDSALASNTLINITSDVILSLLIETSHL